MLFRSLPDCGDVAGQYVDTPANGVRPTVAPLPDTACSPSLSTVDGVYDRVPGVTDLELISSTDGVETFRGTDADTGDAVTVKVLGYEVSADQFDRYLQEEATTLQKIMRDAGAKAAN